MTLTARLKQTILAVPGARLGFDAARRWTDHAVLVRADRVLRRDLSGGGEGSASQPGLEVGEHQGFSELTLRAYRDLGRVHHPDILEARMARRKHFGMRFFALSHGGVVVATAWIIPGGGRPLEEHGLVMTVPANQLWLVDVYVAERGRGRGLFGALVGLILKNYFSDAAVLWSDVSTGNRPSLAAHRKAGFEDVGGIRSIHVAKSLMVRSWALPAQLSVGGFKAGRQVVTTGSAYRFFCSECAI